MVVITLGLFKIRELVPHAWDVTLFILQFFTGALALGSILSFNKVQSDREKVLRGEYKVMQGLFTLGSKRASVNAKTSVPTLKDSKGNEYVIEYEGDKEQFDGYSGELLDCLVFIVNEGELILFEWEWHYVK